MITYEQYLKLVDNTFNSFGWRYGQTVMNVLHAVNPKMYDQLVMTEYDCYYNDDKYKHTLELLKQKWKT